MTVASSITLRQLAVSFARAAISALGETFANPPPFSAGPARAWATNRQATRARDVLPPWVGINYPADRRRLSRAKTVARVRRRVDSGDLGLHRLRRLGLAGNTSLLKRCCRSFWLRCPGKRASMLRGSSTTGRDGMRDVAKNDKL